MAKPVDTEATTSGTTTATAQQPPSRVGTTATKVAPRTERSAAETEKIRVALSGAARPNSATEYDVTMTEITELQRDRLTDSAGDDQADTGTKTFEREQEMTPRPTCWSGSPRSSGPSSGSTRAATAGVSAVAIRFRSSGWPRSRRLPSA